MSTTLNDSLKIVQQHFDDLKEEFSVKRIGIFGSVAEGRDSKESDVDVLVEFEDSPDMFEFIRLENILSDLLDREVDLVTPNALKPMIKKTVLQETVYA